MNISKRTQLIIGIVVAVIMLGAGGYLLWRTNQETPVAPTDSEAGYCESKVYKNGGWVCIDYAGAEYELDDNGNLTTQQQLDADANNKANGFETDGNGGSDATGSQTCNTRCSAGTDCLTGHCYMGYCRNIACPTNSDCQCDSGTQATTELLSCGANNCTVDADCEGFTEGTHECDEVTSGDTSQQYCVRISCPEGQELAEDRCTCVDSQTCGDGTCDPDENSETCPEDCTPECGDGICNEDENANTCPNDCDAECGDGFCTHDETVASCPEDCTVATATPEAGIFDDISNSMKLGLGFISLGFITTQVNKVATAYDIAVGNREIKIRRKRRENFEKKI